jgi:polyphosphate glucokinase
MITDRLTLSVDCGGLFIKSCLLDDAGTIHSKLGRIETPYPLPPSALVQTLAGIAAELPPIHRATVGLPGMIRNGVVVAIPHYVNQKGPHSRLVPRLRDAWHGFDMQAALTGELKVPTLVLNDAEVHGAGVVSGSGYEVVMTLGTGLGFAIFFGGRLAPHFELSHAPARPKATYDTWIGEYARRRLGNVAWSRRIRQMIESLQPVFRWDRLYVGGGNARCIRRTDLEKLGDQVVIIPNSAGVAGGVRAWQLPKF